MSFKSSIQFILITAALLFLDACAPKPKQAETKLNLVSSSLFASDINISGGALVYGQSKEGSSFGKTFLPGSDVVVEMDYGTWNFSIIAYSGPSKLSGTRECAVLNDINIANDSQTIDVKIAAGNCPAAGVYPTHLKRCSQAEFDMNDPQGQCTQTTQIKSYRVRYLAHENGSPNGDGLLSDCVNSASFDSVVLALPTGATNTRVAPLNLVLFTGTNCDAGTGTRLSLKSFSRPDLPNDLKYKFAASTAYLGINLSGPNVDNTAPALAITADDSTFDGANYWINNGTQSIFSITGTCENGLPVKVSFAGIAQPDATCTGTFITTIDFSGYTDFGLGSEKDLVLSQTDAGGNTGSVTRSYLKDTLIPSVSLTSPPSLLLGGSIKNISFSSTDDQGIASHEIFYAADGATYTSVATGITTSPYGWSVPAVDTTGSRIRIISTDLAGNTSVPLDSTAFDIDSTPPAVTLTDLAAEFAGGSTQNVTFTTSDLNGVAALDLQYAADGVNYTSLQTNPISPFSWTTPSTTTTGSKLRLIAIDSAGNSTTVENATFIIDNNPPVLAPIADTTINENTTNPALIDATDSIGGGDIDGNGDTLTYNCYYDTVVDGSVILTNDCNTLPSAASFDPNTGILSWDPSYFSSGVYEIQIMAQEPVLFRTDSQIFVVTVNNVNRPPVLAQVDDQLQHEGTTLNLDLNDVLGGDNDVDTEPITYECYFDTIMDKAVNTTNLCTSLPGGATFDPNTGVLAWPVPLTAASSYEFKVIASDGTDIDSQIFYANIVDSTEVPPIITSLKVWLKSDPLYLYQDTAGTIAATNGSSIGAWRNAIPIPNNNAFLATSGSATNFPTLQIDPSGSLTNRPIVTVDGNDYLSLPDHPSYGAVTESTVVVYAVKSGNQASGTQHLINKQDPNRSFTLYTGVSPFTLRSFQEDSALATHGLMGTAWDGTTPSKRCVTIKITTGAHELLENGTSQQSSVAAGYYSGTGSTFIGSNSSGTGSYWIGGIAEILIYDSALSLVDINSVCTYLDTKYL